MKRSVKRRLVLGAAALAGALLLSGALTSCDTMLDPNTVTYPENYGFFDNILMKIESFLEGMTPDEADALSAKETDHTLGEAPISPEPMPNIDDVIELDTETSVPDPYTPDPTRDIGLDPSVPDVILPDLVLPEDYAEFRIDENILYALYGEDAETVVPNRTVVFLKSMTDVKKLLKSGGSYVNSRMGISEFISACVAREPDFFDRQSLGIILLREPSSLNSHMISVRKDAATVTVEIDTLVTRMCIETTAPDGSIDWAEPLPDVQVDCEECYWAVVVPVEHGQTLSLSVDDGLGYTDYIP